MTEVAKLVIAVDSRGAKTATHDLLELERAANATGREAHKLGTVIGRYLGAALASGTVAAAAHQYIRLSDTWANMTARLKAVTNSSEQLKHVQGELSRLAHETGTDLEGVTDLYTKLANSSDKLRTNQGLLIGVTENVSKALSLSGADAASAAAVIRQFSQAMASGTLRGDEFVSVMEGAPRLARAIADGLDVPVGKLREMAAQGKLTAETVIDALESQSQKLETEYANMPLTVGKAMQQVRNSLLELAGDTDQTTGATADLAKEVSNLADILKSEATKSAFASIVGGFTSATSAAVEFHGAVKSALSTAQEWLILRQDISNAGIPGGAATSLKRKQLSEIEAEQSRRKGQGALSNLADRAYYGTIGQLVGSPLMGESDSALIQRARQLRSSIEMDRLIGLDDQALKINWRGSDETVEEWRARKKVKNESGGGGGSNKSGAPGRTRTATSDFAEWTRRMQESITLQEALAVAYGKGEAAVASATLAHETELLVLKHGAAKRAEITALVEREARLKAEVHGAQTLANLEREIELYGQTGRAAVVAYDLAKGALANLDEQQKKNIQSAADYLDFLEDLKIHEATVAEVQRELAGRTKTATDEMNAIAEQAARNIQDLLGNAMFDVLDGKFSDIGDSFANMLKRMAAELAASKLLELLGSAMAGYGGKGGWGDLVRSIGGSLGGKGGGGYGGGRAMGGPVSGGRLYEVGEGGRPELFEQNGRTFLIPGNNGRVTPASRSGGGSMPAPRVTVNIHNAPQGADVQQRQGPDGGLDIDVIFRQLEGRMASNLADGSSPIGAAMKGRYGLREVV